MTEHVCPVGALTSKDFRFKARVWFLRSQKGVCSGCATGCNSYVDYDPRDNHVYRLRPRDNLKVNRFWMCDDGMMTYKQVHEGRIESGIVRANDSAPAARGGANGSARATTPDEALISAANSLRGVQGGNIAVVLSAQHSSEDNYAAFKLAAALGTDKVYMAALGGWEGDEILRSSDNNPNRAGVKQIANREPPAVSALLQDVAVGRVQAVIALGSAAAELPAQLAALRGVPMVCFASNLGPLSDVARVVVPVSHHAEMDGTFVNRDGVAQRFFAAVPAPEGVKPAWQALAALAVLLDRPLGFSQLAELRKSSSIAAPAGAEARA
jgi:NADH-quinone oxidoreductase subunit G